MPSYSAALPNGSALSTRHRPFPTAGWLPAQQPLRCACAGRIGSRVAVVPCGERWPDDSLRPAVEDLLGAGAIISHLAGSKSPEADTAQTLFGSCRTDLARIIATCASGRELIKRGYRADIDHAVRLDCSDSAPRLQGECFVDANATVREPRPGT